jgi:acyl-CoA synthetase (AMP-forming)/AMP-acid ligase II
VTSPGGAAASSEHPLSESAAGPDTWTGLVVAAHRDSPRAVVGRDRVWSGPELLARAAGAAAWLESLDLPPDGAVPAFFGATTGEAMAATLGGSAVRRPLAPLAPRLTVPELVPAVAALDSPVIVADAGSLPLADAVAEATGRRAVAVPDPLPLGAGPLPVPPPDAVAGWLHTSGTTGRPKPVPMTQARLAARARLNRGLLEFDRDSVYLTGSPWHHIAGSGNVLVAMAAGAAVTEVTRFGVDEWRRLRALPLTHVLLVPSMLEVLLAEDLLEPGALRQLHYGAAPIHPDTVRRVLDVLPGVRLVQLFGQTEGSPITWLSPEEHQREPELLRSVGRAVPGLELRIADPDPDGVGEITARGPHLMRPGPDGWLRTGDLGRLDAEGFLYLAGRLADKIVRGGENVFPIEVENVLATHAQVAEIGVVGVPDRRLGETVAAFVVPTDAAEPPSWERLRAFARERLAGFKVPVEWHLVEALPRNAAGKVLRRELLRLRG